MFSPLQRNDVAVFRRDMDMDSTAILSLCNLNTGKMHPLTLEFTVTNTQTLKTLTIDEIDAVSHKSKQPFHDLMKYGECVLN